MKKVKNLFLYIVSSIFYINMESVEAKGIDLDITNESLKNLAGYTINLQLCQEAMPIHTQIIDVSSIPPQKTKRINLKIDLEKLVNQKDASKNTTCLSLLDNSGNKVAADVCTLNFYDLTKFPVFQIKLNADKKEASINSMPDIMGMALLEAQQS